MGGGSDLVIPPGTTVVFGCSFQPTIWRLSGRGRCSRPRGSSRRRRCCHRGRGRLGRSHHTDSGTIAIDAYLSTKQREDLERTLGSLLPPSSPAAVFISYRRNQDVWAARNIRSELASPFGEGSVFMDTESIELRRGVAGSHRQRDALVQRHARPDRPAVAGRKHWEAQDRRPDRLGSSRGCLKTVRFGRVAWSWS